MCKADQYYLEVLETPNLFHESLSQQRAAHIRAFATIAHAWCTPSPETALIKLNRLDSGDQLNEIFWLTELAKAIAFGVLFLRFKQAAYWRAASEHLGRIRLVQGTAAELQREIEQDFILNYLVHRHEISN